MAAEFGPKAVGQIKEIARRVLRSPQYRPTAQKRRHVSVSSVATIGIPFRNDSGMVIPPHGVMYATDTVLISGKPFVTVERPGSVFDRHWLVNGKNPVPVDDTDIGTWLSESARVAYDTSYSEPLAGDSWGVKPDSFLLHYERPGFTIIGGPTTVSGQAVVEAKQHEVNDVFGKLYDDLLQGEDALFEIWYRMDGKLRVSGFDKITVHDFFMNKDERVEKDTKAIAHWYSNHWEISNAYCAKANDEESQLSPGAQSQGGVNPASGQALSFGSESQSFSGSLAGLPAGFEL